MITRLTLARGTATALAVALCLGSLETRGDEGSTDAARHFARGVSLYAEADYRSAVVEFERAYAASPNLAVLYNIGETRFQMRDYAGSLASFERYLAEAPPTDGRRAEVEGDLEVLRSRVARLSIVTQPPGAEVTVDDREVGRTPLDAPVVVSIGRRKVVASLRGHRPAARDVDVAAGDETSVVLDLPAPEAAPATATARPSSATESTSPPVESGGNRLRMLGWFLTGTSAAGAITFGVLALSASHDLEGARAAYPTSAATLSHDASLATTYSLVADSLTAAALIVGGITLYATVSSSRAPAASGGLGAARVMLGSGSARFEATF
jgi:tetratricopeptide (TPR) repeat protein